MSWDEEQLLIQGQNSRQHPEPLVATTSDQPQARQVRSNTEAWAADPSRVGEDGKAPAKPGPSKRPIWPTAGVHMLKEVWREKGSPSGPTQLILFYSAVSVQGQETSKGKE